MSFNIELNSQPFNSGTASISAEEESLRTNSQRPGDPFPRAARTVVNGAQGGGFTITLSSIASTNHSAPHIPEAPVYPRVFGVLPEEALNG